MSNEDLPWFPWIWGRDPRDLPHQPKIDLSLTNFPNFPAENAVLFFKLYLSISTELNPNLFITKGKPWYIFFLTRVFFQTLTVQSTILFLSTTTTHSRTFRHLFFCKFACEMTTYFQSNRLWPLERYLIFTTFLNYCLIDWWDAQNSRFRCTVLSL